MCCFQCEVNKRRQKRARDYFEASVCFCVSTRRKESQKVGWGKTAATLVRARLEGKKERGIGCIINALIKI